MDRTADQSKPRLSLAQASDEGTLSFQRSRPYRLIGGSGASLLIHAVALLIFSLIMMSQSRIFEPKVMLATIEDTPTGDGGTIELLELNVEDSRPSLLETEFTSAAVMPGVGVQDNERPLDVSGLLLQGEETPDGGLPSGIATVAAGIQKRVAEAGGRKGEVQFSLAWHSLNDLDLHVVAPSGQRIWYGAQSSKCRGKLDVDMNASVGMSLNDKTVSEDPVENVRWLVRSAPTGRFTVIVHQYQWRNGRTDDDFQLLANLGESTQLIRERVTVERPISVHRFQYIGASQSKARMEKRRSELDALQSREEAEASEMFEKAVTMEISRDRQRVFQAIVDRFPHTDTAIRAMQELEASTKN